MGISGAGDFAMVIASDAPTWKKTYAKYYCDGTNDEVQIKQAITDLSSAGGTIVLSEGTFNIGEPKAEDITNAATINIHTGLHIVGSGKGATFLRYGASRGAGADRYMVRAVGASGGAITNWSVNNLTITCQDAQDHGIGLTGTANFLIENVEILHTANEASTDEGIQFAGGGPAGVSDGVLRNVYLNGGHSVGVEFRAGDGYCRRISCYDVIADGCLASGIQIFETADNAPVDLDFYGCWGNNSSNSGADGWTIDGSQDIRIHGGGAVGNAGDGITMAETNAAPLRCVFSGVSVRENGASGIVYRGTQHRTIGCTAVDNTASGFRPAVAGAGANWFQNNVAMGIDATPTNGFKENNNPTGNVYIGNHADGNTNDWALGSNYSTISNSLNTGTGNPVP